LPRPKEISTKRQKTDSSPANFAATHQSPRPKTSPASAKKTGANFNRPVNRNQSSASVISRNQRHQQAHDSRRITPSFRPTYQGLINANPSSIEGAGVNRSLQQQQQAANAFIQQARMITLMSQQQPQQQQQQQRNQSLMGQGQQQQQQQPWQSIMGGPPPQQSYGGICRNCGTQFLQGQPYCNNCRAPLH
uniref:Zinc_ribbon_2 domain-containing protein n=1 Tax=Hymenolepis diminuta TaxID=6216 RepID=A0A0R3SJJ1_HYMDI